jgi:hypothetical protein
MNFVKEKYIQACNLIKEDMNQKYETCSNLMQNFQGIVPQEHLSKVKDDQECVRNLEKILIDTCKESQLKVSA